MKLQSSDFVALAFTAYLPLLLLPERPGIIEMPANFLGLMLFPGPLLCITHFATRQWRRGLLWLIPSLAFVWFFGELFLPTLAPHRCESPACRHLTVMTYNMFGVPDQDRAPMVEAIRESGADIVALQEVDEPGVALIETELSQLYPYQELYAAGVAGTGLLSKFPFETVGVSELTPMTFNTHAIINVEGTRMGVISAHPPPPITSFNLRYNSRGSKEIRALLDLAPTGLPTILAGDFNHTDMAQDYRLLPRAGYRDTFREVGWGFGMSWPCRIRRQANMVPLVRIDYLWHSAEFAAVRCWVGESAGSDHRAIFAEFALGPVS